MSKKPTEKQLAARAKFRKSSNLMLGTTNHFWNKKGEVKERTFENYEKKENSKT